MRRFVEEIDREQATLFPECLEDWIDADDPVRAIDAFIDKLDPRGQGFDGVAPEATGRPSFRQTAGIWSLSGVKRKFDELVQAALALKASTVWAT